MSKLPSSRAETASPLMSRRNFLRAGGAVAGLAVLPKTLEVGAAVADALYLSDDERAELRRRRDAHERRRIEAEDREQIANALRHNQAKPIKKVTTRSGMVLDVYQAQTGWNAIVPLGVNAEAMSNSIDFLIGSMDKINEANGKPIQPRLITAFQEKARAGSLGNIQMTVIASATTGFHGPDGLLRGGGAAFNGHPHRGDDVRTKPLPLIAFSPDIYNPGEELLTPTPVEGRFADDDMAGLEKIKPTSGQTLSAYFAHEAAHVLWDVVGNDFMEDLAYNNPEHSAFDFEHKMLVLPLNWYHTAALTGRVEGQPQLADSFTVPPLQ